MALALEGWGGTELKPDLDIPEFSSQIPSKSVLVPP